jgi:hypothetical protein
VPDVVTDAWAGILGEWRADRMDPFDRTLSEYSHSAGRKRRLIQSQWSFCARVKAGQFLFGQLARPFDVVLWISLRSRGGMSIHQQIAEACSHSGLARKAVISRPEVAAASKADRLALINKLASAYAVEHDAQLRPRAQKIVALEEGEPVQAKHEPMVIADFVI